MNMLQTSSVGALRQISFNTEICFQDLTKTFLVSGQVQVLPLWNVTFRAERRLHKDIFVHNNRLLLSLNELVLSNGKRSQIGSN